MNPHAYIGNLAASNWKPNVGAMVSNWRPTIDQHKYNIPAVWYARPRILTSQNHRPIFAVMSSPPLSTVARDTIPRMYHLTYLPVVLAAVAEGATLDGIRSLVWEEARAMSRRVGPVAPQPDDGYVHWSTTKDALGECMKLGLIEKAVVPSKRVQVDAHRGRTYALTPAGARLVADIQARP